MWLGGWVMSEAISDTGPILHLHEISQLSVLGAFERLSVPGLVADELNAYGLDIAYLEKQGINLSIVSVSETDRKQALAESNERPIHPADAQVLVLARNAGFRKTVLTDDLALKRRLETHGAVVTGTVGVLVRAYKMGRLERGDLESAVDALFDKSTLHLSRAFRAYVRRLVTDLP